MRFVPTITRVIWTVSLMWITASPEVMASEPVRAASPKPLPLPPSQASSILVDGRPQTLTFVLGEDIGRYEVVTENDRPVVQRGPSRTCTSVSQYRPDITYDCTPLELVKRRVHVGDVVNRVTVVIPEATSRFGSIDELLDISQKDASIYVSASKTSKRVLIYAEADTRTISSDRAAGMRELATTVNMRFEDLAKAARPVTEGMTDMGIKGRRFSYRIGRVMDPSILQVTLTVKTASLFFERQLTIGTLAPDVFEVVDEGELFSRVIVDLGKLNIVQKMRGKELVFEVVTSLEVPREGLVNFEDLPRLAILTEWKTKIEKDWCLGCD